MTLDDVINAKIAHAFRSARMTSANPTHINYFIDDKGFGAEGGGTVNMEEAIRQAVREIIGQEGGTGEGGEVGGGVGKEVAGEAAFAGMAGKGVAMARAPQAAIMGGAMGAIKFLPHAALVVLAVALVPIIFDEITKAGGPMDLRWKRIMSDEFNAFLDRQTQRNTQIGTRQVIIQSKAGFINLNGAGGNANNLRTIREGGISGNRLATQMVNHAKGLW